MVVTIALGPSSALSALKSCIDCGNYAGHLRPRSDNGKKAAKYELVNR